MKINLLLIAILWTLGSGAQGVRDYAVELKKTSDQYPYGIAWRSNPSTQSTVIFSKDRDSLSWIRLDSFSGTQNQFVDSSLQPGQRKDYYVKAYRGAVTAHGYISIGHQYDAIQQSKTLILVVDSNYLLPLSDELNLLYADLRAENWNLKILYAGRSEAVSDVKSRIHAQWLNDTLSLTMVYLLGRIPVPYSGVLAPDGHWDHFGAWPADVYYVNFESIWTDSTMDYAIASSPRNYNVPGDGKFDPWETSPSAAKLGIGRVDLSDMSLFGDDTTLMRRYLSKAHRYRRQNVRFTERAIIDDNFGTFYGEAFASGAWRNFSTILSNDSIQNQDYHASLRNADYLFSYGCGAGSYQGASGVGNSTQMAADSLINPFTFMFGSYFGDWDNPNNYLRAPLAAKGWGLINFWSGRPHAVMHHAALGDPIGVISLEAQKADSAIYHVGYGDAFVHTALMGDPSLPVYPLKPAEALTAQANCSEQRIRLDWTKTADWDSTDIVNWDSLSNWQVLARISGQDSSWTGSFAAGTYRLGIRGRNLRFTPSGSFYQYSPVLADSILLNPLYLAQMATVPDSICFGQQIRLQAIQAASNGLNRNWLINNVGLGSALDTSLLLAYPGNHRIRLEILSDSGCFSADSFDVVQMPELTSAWQLASDELCFGSDLVLEAKASHGKVNWLLNGQSISADSTWTGSLSDTDWHLVQLELQDELACSKAWKDSIRYLAKLELSHGFSPVNHSICINSPQERGIFQITTQRSSNLYVQLDQAATDTQLVQNYFAKDFYITDTGMHTIRWTLSDSLCQWSDSIAFRAYPKARAPMTQTNWVHSARAASLVVGDFQSKAHYTWGGSWSNAAADSVHKRYYDPATNQDGNYTQWVILEDSVECYSDTVYFDINLQTGIQTHKADFAIQVYPNPNQGEFSYAVESELESLHVLSGDGKVVWTASEPKRAAKLKLDLAPGLYTLHFRLANGRQAYARISIQSRG